MYQDRLNAIAYGEWSTPAPVVVVAGNKLICYVTVVLCGVPHTDVGEATNNEENTGTEAYAQAFKRACSQFGLGRYLYDLEKEWVPFDLQRKQISLDKAQKQAIVKKMYQKAGIVVGTPKVERNDQALHDLAKPGPARIGNPPPNVPSPEPATEQQLASIRKLLQHLGKPEEVREDLRYLEAKSMITELSRQWHIQHQPTKDTKPGEEPQLVNGDGTPSTPKPYTVAEVKALFGKTYKPDRWSSFVVNVIGKSVDDADLSDLHLEMLQAKLVETRKAMAR